jgi:serpin B
MNKQRSNLTSIGVSFLAFLLLTHCTKKSSEISPTPTSTPGTSETLLKSGKELSQTQASEIPFKMYQLLAADPKDVCLSPLSLEQALGLLYLGANGETKATIEGITGAKDDEPYSLQNEKLGETIDFEWANSIWIKANKKLSPSFIQSSKNKLNAESFPSIEVQKINTWVEKQTQGKVKDLIKTLQLDTLTVFINAFYLKAPWEKPFEKSQNLIGPFQSSPNLASQVIYLSATQTQSYFEDESSKWTALPYQGGTLQMLLALPKKKLDLRAIEDKLSTSYLDQVQKGFKPERVDLKLPKFKIEATLSLVKILQNMGYSELFQRGDFSRMSLNPIQISEILQATYLKVDENGTEAAAATAVALETTSMPSLTSPKTFYANEPFLFFIQNTKTKKIYFIGRVFQPKE